jgi:hypothetical protein
MQSADAFGEPFLAANLFFRTLPGVLAVACEHAGILDISSWGNAGG